MPTSFAPSHGGPTVLLLASTDPYHADSQGHSSHRLDHPGEQVVGVMTAHLAWPQPQYDRIRAGSSPRLRDWIQKGSGPAGAVEEN